MRWCLLKHGATPLWSVNPRGHQELHRNHSCCYMLLDTPTSESKWSKASAHDDLLLQQRCGLSQLCANGTCNAAAVSPRPCFPGNGAAPYHTVQDTTVSSLYDVVSATVAPVTGSPRQFCFPVATRGHSIPTARPTFLVHAQDDLN